MLKEQEKENVRESIKAILKMALTVDVGVTMMCDR